MRQFSNVLLVIDKAHIQKYNELVTIPQRAIDCGPGLCGNSE